MATTLEKPDSALLAHGCQIDQGDDQHKGQEKAPEDREGHLLVTAGEAIRGDPCCARIVDPMGRMQGGHVDNSSQIRAGLAIVTLCGILCPFT